MTRLLFSSIALFLLSLTSVSAQSDDLSYPIVDTGLEHCFSADAAITCGTAFTGQDAEYNGLQPNYQVNGDGTVTDLNTGLMWQQDPGEKVTYDQAVAGAANLNLGAYTDWRLPTIKELYSLILFTGIDASAATTTSDLRPYIDDSVVAFEYGDTSTGARLIDSQWATATLYESTVMNGQQCFFGVNFADGRIKCYPTQPGGNGGYFVIYVRGNTSYGINAFVDNGDSTITDNATGLTWAQDDSGTGLLWADALAYCQALDLGGQTDWRLPNAKELHSIVDYSRSPDTTNSAAVDPLFNTMTITNEAGQLDYAQYWTSTTHIAYPDRVSEGVYVNFGRAMGNMQQFGGWVDVHGAGAQRSDPKAGATPDQLTNGRGPQGDAIRSENAVRCVRGGTATSSTGASPDSLVMPGVGGTPSNEANPPPQNQGAPNLTQAAQQLGVTEQALVNALGTQRPPDFAAAARQLGMSEQALRQALGAPPTPPRS